MVIFLPLLSNAQNLPSDKAEFTTKNPVIPLANPFQILRENLKNNEYLKVIAILKNREEEYLNSQFKVLYLEFMSVLNSFVNRYEDASKYENILLDLPQFNALRKNNAKEISSSPLDSLKSISAREAILEIADHHQVIMINEEHRQPSHRAFLLGLLKDLYAKGFKYLALEAISAKDSLLNERGYANQSTGFYTSDPVYGNLIRKAKVLGFTIIPYEYEGGYPDNISSDQEQEIREKGQAENLIAKTIKQDVKAKLIVFAGRTHIAETQTPNFSFMAWHFKNLSGINPYTIDQVMLSGKLKPIDELPLYKHLVNTKNPKEPTVFAKVNNYWSETESYDMQIFHPRTENYNGRPVWLYDIEIKIPTTISHSKLGLPVKKGFFLGDNPIETQVLLEGDSLDAVPIDIVVVNPGEKLPELLLLKGKNIIRAKNEDGEIVGEYVKTLIR